MPKSTVSIHIMMVLVALLLPSAYARDLHASLAFLPKISESSKKGAFVDLVKAIDTEYEDDIQIEIYPFPRSIDNVIVGKADFHIPIFRNNLIEESKLPYRYASEIMGQVQLVIYSNKNKPITVETINAAKESASFNLTIESGTGFENYFDFPILSRIDMDSSLKKVNAGRVDAVIFAQEELDYLCKTLKLKNLYRSPYDKFDDVIIIPKGEKGDEIDEILSEILIKLKSTGQWQELYQQIHLPYQNWQPYEMNW